MFVQIADSDLINFGQADIINVFSWNQENIVRMIFPSSMIVEIVYEDNDQCLKAMESMLDAFRNGEKQLSLTKNDLSPAHVRYERVAVRF